MHIGKKKITISALIVVVFVSVIVWAATSYPNAAISFSGIKMVANGSTTQGFVDISLKNIDSTAISYCIEYDKNYIELSDVATNTPIKNPTTSSGSVGYSYDIAHDYFEQNTDDFPIGSFGDFKLPSMIGVSMPIIGVADADNGRAIMNFLPQEGTTSKYITAVKGRDEHLILANGKNLKLGRLSFYIKDPAKFAKLSKSELKDVIKIVPFSTMITVQDDTITDDDGVHIGYIDSSDGDVKWYSRADKNVECNFEIEAALSNVKALNEELTVTSYDIYKNGTIDDLLDFINDKMSIISLQYADGSERPAVFKWDKTTSNLSSISWNPKEGDYTVVQKYNDDFDITVTIHVMPINLIGFTAENENLTYWTGAADYPATIDDLKLAPKAKPILDKYIPNGGVPEFNIGWYQLSTETSQLLDIPDDIKNKVVGKYTILGHIADINKISINYPWLTVKDSSDVNFIRNVVDNESELPKELVVVSAVTADDGTLTITVKNKDGNTIPAGTTFDVRMPGGELIDSSMSGYNVVVNDDGTATITVKADIAIDSEKKLAQIINLGSKAGKFEISSTEPGKNPGPYTEFSTNPRKNIYLDSYTFDYSDLQSAMFPIKAGVSLPTTVTLPVLSDFVGTTYDGYDGTEIGKLSTFTVDSWDVIDGDPTLVGSVVTVRGTLSTTSYTNYGNVVNENNNTVEIKYLVVNGDDRDEIYVIPDFTYDKKQVGYDYNDLQTNSFTVKNIGSTDIYGLTAAISLSKDGNKEAFTISKKLPQILQKGESVDFDITTNIGLDVGTYECTVSVISNEGVLRTFKISFEVTEAPTYKIELVSDNVNYGKAETDSGLYTASEGEAVSITATPEEDCVFAGWTCETGNVTFADSTLANTTFEMPAENVKITAHFKESLGAKLRATELMVKDTNDNDQDLHDQNWKIVKFDPVKREYYVAVPNSVDKVKLWFKLRDEAKNATLSLSREHNSVTDTLTTPTEDATDNYYKSEDIELDVSPVDNLLTLTMTYDDPNDDPDEGEVTRSYKIHVYKKIEESKLMKFNYGNSPYGLIMRDTAITDKATAKNEFDKNDYTFTAGYTPAGATVGVNYCGEAWTSGVNYDLDDTALFVLNSGTFADPGYESVINSIGGAVTDVTKKITVNVLTETNAAYQDGGSTDYSSVNAQTINLPSSGTISELNAERIRPDKYELVYSFADFDGSIVSIKRPLILLNTLGDVNNDKQADTKDVSRIRNRFSADLANNTNVTGYDVGGLLNRYRICDVNKDRAVNLIDANNIRAKKMIQFYTNDGGGA